MLRVAFVGVAILIGATGTAWAQSPAQNSEAEQIKARQKIFMMEGVLERAVQVGIDSFRRQLSAVMPDDMLLVSGDGPAARGFRLDGYGVFFDVEVPGVRPSLAWSLRTMNETAAMFSRDLAQVRAQIRQAVTDPRQRQEMDRALAPHPGAGGARIAARAVAGPTRWADRGRRDAQRPVGRRGSGAAGPAATGCARLTRRRLPSPSTPGEVFTKAVADALVDAMLENSGSLIIAPEEWLTVAARDNAQGNRFVASDPSDVMTIVLRVKGSDLAAFQARRLTLDEVRKRVEVRAF